MCDHITLTSIISQQLRISVYRRCRGEMSSSTHTHAYGGLIRFVVSGTTVLLYKYIQMSTGLTKSPILEQV